MDEPSTKTKETKMIYSYSQDYTQVVIVLEGQFKDLPISTVLYSLAEQINKEEQANVSNTEQTSRGEETRSTEDTDGPNSYCGAV